MLSACSYYPFARGCYYKMRYWHSDWIIYMKISRTIFSNFLYQGDMKFMVYYKYIYWMKLLTRVNCNRNDMTIVLNLFIFSIKRMTSRNIHWGLNDTTHFTFSHTHIFCKAATTFSSVRIFLHQCIKFCYHINVKLILND